MTLRVRVMNKYTVEFFWSDEDEGFIATVPDLPGCSAFGETRAEAATEVEDAIAAWIEAAQAAGNPIPDPSPRSDFDNYSGKLLLRMPRELHRDLQVAAKAQGVSLNSYVCFMLAKKHYHTHAIKEFASSLQWQTIGFRSGASVQHYIQLASVSTDQELKHFSASTAVQQPDTIVTPLAAVGVSYNA